MTAKTDQENSEPKRRRADLMKSLAKKWSIRIGALLLGLLVFFAIGIEVTGSPEFCASCHNMQPYVDSWRQSSHNTVNCSQCHYEPGFYNYIKGKVTDGQAHLVIFITGKTRGKYHAEISDVSCLQCHAKESLKGPKEFKGITFSHSNHLDQMRREKQLRCVTCHGQLVQGEHLTVDERECFICHFKADEKGQRDPVLSNCRTCHKEVPVEIPVDGHVFQHGRYIDSGIDCNTCHVGIIKGKGDVDFEHCMECHSEKEKTLKELIKTKYTTESYHRNHVTNHKVECWRCHETIQHEIVRNPTSQNFGNNCTTCHSDSQHLGPREMYKGVGGIGTPDSPSKMYLANVDCASCHVKKVQGQFGDHATDVDFLNMGQACNSCHGAGYDSMLHHWQKILFEAETDAGRRLLDAETEMFKQQKITGMSQAFREAAKLLTDARHNVEFVKVGKGHHNVEYAMKLLNAAMKMTEEAKGLLVSNYAGQPVPAVVSNCTVMCHSEMETRKVQLGSIQYPHKTHVVDLGFACTDCHGDLEHHGQMKLENCNECHHGEGKGKVGCTDCHASVAALVKGQGARAVTGTPDPMNSNIGCVDCHTQVKAGQKTTLDGVKANCVNCHDATYTGKMDERIAEIKKAVDERKAALAKIEKDVATRKQQGQNVMKLNNKVLFIKHDIDLIDRNRGQHNIEYARKVIVEIDTLLQETQKLL